MVRERERERETWKREPVTTFTSFLFLLFSVNSHLRLCVARRMDIPCRLVLRFLFVHKYLTIRLAGEEPS